MEQFSVTRHQSGSFAFVGSHCLQYTPDPATCILPFFVFLSETATSAGPVPLILYFTDQVQAGAVLGPFVGALGSVQGTRLILGVFVGFNDGGL